VCKCAADKTLDDAERKVQEREANMTRPPWQTPRGYLLQLHVELEGDFPDLLQLHVELEGEFPEFGGGCTRVSKHVCVCNCLELKKRLHVDWTSE